MQCLGHQVDSIVFGLMVYSCLYCAPCFATWQNLQFGAGSSNNVFVCWNAEISSGDWVRHFALWAFCSSLVYSACSPRCDRTSKVLYGVQIPTAPIAVPRPKCHAGCSKPLGPPQDLSLHWSSEWLLWIWYPLICDRKVQRIAMVILTHCYC